MCRKEGIWCAYKYLGKEATFYDVMITCPTISDKAIWSMNPIVMAK